jgi:dimeric dUTPase (all-alpha-NTP-PPase superfamily)
MNAEMLNKLNKFFLDPDWPLVEGILKEYIAPLKLITSIDLTQDSQAVHAEMKANIIATDALEQFLSEVGMLKARTTTTNNFR